MKFVVGSCRAGMGRAQLGLLLDDKDRGVRATGQPDWRRHGERNYPFAFPPRQHSLSSFKLHVTFPSESVTGAASWPRKHF